MRLAKNNYDQLQSYVVFMRYKRSGSALLSVLLNAHPDIMFPRVELLYEKFHKFKTREDLFDHVAKASRRYTSKTFSANGYRYPIHGSGTTRKPLVIGHKSATRTFLPLAEGTKLKEFGAKVEVPLKVIHLVRNPYNMIAARWMQKEWRRDNKPVGPIIDDIIKVAEANHKIWCMNDGTWDRLYTVKLEELIATPRGTMTASS
jgi:hypothetical protein